MLKNGSQNFQLTTRMLCLYIYSPRVAMAKSQRMVVMVQFSSSANTRTLEEGNNLRQKYTT